MGRIDPETGKETCLEIDELIDAARAMRAWNVTSIHCAGSGHPGGTLSIMDVCAALYLRVLRHAPEDPHWEGRDRVFFSAGHKAPALYVSLAAAGYYPLEETMKLRRFGAPYEGHPHWLKLGGVEFSSGSLGQGLGFAVGHAVAGMRDADADWRVYCITGDGEHDEGSIWEAVMSAPHYGVDNIVNIVDKNSLQIDGLTKDVMNIDPLPDKYRAFNWHVIEIDGHDMQQIVDAFDEAKTVKGKPTVIIAQTVKGKGVSFMENEAGWHGVATDTREQLDQALADIGHPDFTKERVDELLAIGEAYGKKAAAEIDAAMPTFKRDYWWNSGDAMQVEMDATRNGFGRAIEDAGQDQRVVPIHADISGSIRITQFEEEHPEREKRSISCGIAEQNMVSVGGGLARAGLVPIAGTYGVFATGRCWDQLRTTICYGELNLKVAGAHGGISVGPDGATHQSLEEISVMSILPNMHVSVPCDAIECRRACEYSILEIDGPAYIRFAREATPVVTTADTPFVYGTANVIRYRGEQPRFVDAFEQKLSTEYESEGEDLSIIACGPMVPEAMRAAWILKEDEGLETRVVNVHTIKPLDAKAIVAAAADTGVVVTAEEHQVGGFGNIVAGAIARDKPYDAPLLMGMVGVQDKFGQSGEPWELMKAFGLTAEHIAEKAIELLKQKK
ncbi:MAG: transketolase [Armatimonadota bacterium]|jgi:transketolase